MTNDGALTTSASFIRLRGLSKNSFGTVKQFLDLVSGTVVGL